MTSDDLSVRLHNTHVVLGVCGGIAAYKALDLCRSLVRAGARVSTVLTENAKRFVTPLSFAALSHEPVRTSLWNSPEPNPHILLGQSADVIVVAPATARQIAAYVHGYSDDLLTCTLLASRAPVVVAPAMHTEMWQNAATQANVAVLRERGVVIVEPAIGELAGGDVGVGRLADTDDIMRDIYHTCNTSRMSLDDAASLNTALPNAASMDRASHDMRGIRILVTAGGTREPLDPVRYFGNRSSGKQGIALANEAVRRGARVTLVTTQLPDAPTPGVTILRVETAKQMHDAVLAKLSDHDVVIMAAAVADFRPAEVQSQKLKKANGAPAVQLEPTEDILSAIARQRNPRQVVVGFAAETQNVADYAQKKLLAKQLDLIVANDVTEPGSGFGTSTNRVGIYDKSGLVLQTACIPKSEVANRVLDVVREKCTRALQIRNA